MCCFGVECFCRVGVPLQKTIIWQKTKQTKNNCSQFFFSFLLLFFFLLCFSAASIRLLCNYHYCHYYFHFSFFLSPPPLGPYRGVMRLRSAGFFFFYGVWGRAPASEVSAASWRCECIRVCLICGITAEGLCGGKRWRGGRYNPANIVFATSSPHPLYSPLTPCFEELFNSAYHYTRACRVILSNYMEGEKKQRPLC